MRDRKARLWDQDPHYRKRDWRQNCYALAGLAIMGAGVAYAGWQVVEYTGQEERVEQIIEDVLS